MIKPIKLSAALLGGLAFTGGALADVAFSSISSCTEADCSQRRVQLEVLDRDPGRFLFRANEGECVVVRVEEANFSQTSGAVSPDSVLRVNSPDAFLSYFNDDAVNSGELLSRIVIDPVEVTGLHEVSVAPFSLNAINLSNVSIRYGRYPSGNPNCANPTTASQRLAASSAKGQQ